MRLFVSYRRSDSKHATGRLCAYLIHEYGSDNVFYDVGSLGYGVDYRDAIRRWLRAADAMLVLIGSNFDHARLHEVDDPVRLELHEAIRLRKPLVPVLVDHAEMPHANDLPEDLQALAFLNAARLRADPDFQRDVFILVQNLKQRLTSESPDALGIETDQPEKAIPIRATSNLSSRLGATPGPEVGQSNATSLIFGLSLRLRSSPLTPPAPSTSFVGRTKELRSIALALQRSRLVTLTGSGGCGKTRLALEVFRQQGEYGTRRAFVDLSVIRDPALIQHAVARALGVPEYGNAELHTLCELFGPHRLLLLVDNCEHLVEDAADILARLLEGARSLTVLATSREELSIAGEHLIEVQPLGLPARGVYSTSAALTPGFRAGILSSDAVSLFLDRALTASPGLALSDDTLAAIATICAQLDGSPLAIELIAPLAAKLTAVAVAARLDDRLGLLDETRRRGAAPRQRSLRAAMDWSYQLLSDSEKRLFNRLSVFVGDFSLEAAEAMAAGHAPADSVKTLASLIGKSMVVAIDSSRTDGPRRYRLLETLRAYGAERLSLSGAEEAAAELAHAGFYLRLAEEADREVHGPGAAHWLALVSAELGNLRRALAWSFTTKNYEHAARLAGALHWFFGQMGTLDELCEWLDDLLFQREELPPRLRQLIVSARNTLAFSCGDYRRTSELGEEAIELATMLGDRRQLLIALVVRGGVSIYEGNSSRAEECFTAAAPLSMEIGDDWALAWLLTGRGISARRLGELAEAERYLEEALHLFGALGDDHGTVLPLINLAMIAQQRGNFSAARTTCVEALDAARRIGDRQLVHVSVCTLGRLFLADGQVEAARHLLIAALEGFRGVEHWLMVAIALEGLALAGLEGGRPLDAGILLGAADALRDKFRLVRTSDREAERRGIVDALAAALGVAGADHIVQVGRTLTVDEALRRVVPAAQSLPAGVERGPDEARGIGRGRT